MPIIVLLCILLSLSAPLGLLSSAAGTPPLHGVDETFTFCLSLVGSLDNSHKEILRHHIQSVLHLERRFTNLQQLHENNVALTKGAAMKEGMKHAYKTDRTIEEMEASMHALGEKSKERRVAADSLINRLRGENKLPLNATLDAIMPCLSSKLDPQLFPDVPQISFLLQFFGKEQSFVYEVVKRLRAASDQASRIISNRNLSALGLSEPEIWTTIGMPRPRPFSELLVNVDSIGDHETAGLWANLSYEMDGFVVPVFSDNIHEVRGYNRLASIARSQILMFLQDDQLPPNDGTWLVSLLSIFDKYHLVGAVGLHSFRVCPYRGKGVNRNLRGHHVGYRDPLLGVKMQFATSVDFAPLAVRKVALDDVGGLDEGLSEPGVCGIYSDWGLSARMWSAGWWVAYMDMAFPSGKGMEQVGQGGTHRPEVSGRCWDRQARAAGGAFRSQFDPLFPFICARVRELTLQLLTPVEEKGECAFDKDFGGGDMNVTFHPLDQRLVSKSMQAIRMKAKLGHDAEKQQAISRQGG